MLVYQRVFAQCQWMRGKFTGTPTCRRKKPWFPVDVAIINLVKKKIYSELALKKVPHKFREFCISVGANKLFDRILSEVATPRQSTDLANLNQKRVVSVIYNLCYCLGQTCNSLQTDHALYLRSSKPRRE